MHQKIRHMAEVFLDVLYPRKCPFCGDILRPSGTLICTDCLSGLRPLTEERNGDIKALCMKCGAPVMEEEEYCRSCRCISRSFEQNRSIFIYDDKWKLSLERYKFHGYREFADFYAAAMVKWGGDAIRRWKIDLIVPVPMHPKKEKIRGFNQSWHIARRISDRTGIPASRDILVKVKDTAPQKQLNHTQRKNNLKNSFRASSAAAGKTVLVIDDVFTTGSTMDAAAEALLASRARTVYSLTLCIALS